MSEQATSDEAKQVVFETARLVDIVWDKLMSWLETLIAMLPNLAVALVTLVFFGLLARFGSRMVAKSIRRAHVNEQVASLAGLSARVGFIGLGIFLALGVLNLQKTALSLLAGVGVVGLALGFAFQDIASNFMSGLIMALRRPFELGDLVETGGTMGFVERVTLRATVIRTFSGQLVIMPNKDVLQSPIVNYTKEGKRRIEIPVGVAYDTDLSRAIEVACEAASKVDGLDGSEAVDAVFTGFGESSVDLEVHYWLDLSADDTDYLQARSQGIVAVHSAFTEAGIEIPFPIRTIDLPGGPGGEVPRESRGGEESEQTDDDGKADRDAA